MSFLLTIIYVPKLAYRVPCGVNLTQLFTNKAKVFLSIVSGDMPEDLIPGPVKAHLLCAHAVNNTIKKTVAQKITQYAINDSTMLPYNSKKFCVF